MKITRNKNQDNETTVEVKRFYIPFTIETKCPNCNKKNVTNLEREYLSYPPLGDPFEFGFYCSDCDYDWTEKIILDIVLSPHE